ncbi:MAG: hypothetical protein A2Z14_06565 [Chloroflexi bacterium RBG_16_48_8]|nr:MAG: hypothetical protein A2Z14_06565 [Chloroflexi bacterium RBG_16_48_8]
MEKDLEVRSQVTLIVRRWYIVVLFGLLGALAGYGLSFVNPPIYRTHSVFAMGLNFDMTTPLSQYEEDFALGKVAGVVLSDDVIAKAIFILTQREDTVNDELILEDFKSKILLEQKGSRWELNVFGEDPELIAAMANSWAEAAEDSLWDAYAHALQANSLKYQLESINKELRFLKTEDDRNPQNRSRIEDLEKLISEMDTQIQVELELGRGLTTFLSFEWTEQAMVPQGPATRSRGGQILAGNLLGITMGSLMIILFRSIKNKPGRFNIT